MTVDLTHAVGQMRDKCKQAFLGDGSRPGEPEDMVICNHPGTTDLTGELAGPEAKRQGAETIAPREAHGRSDRLRGLCGQSDGTEAEATSNSNNHGGDGGMKMNVFVRVDVIERQSCRSEGGKLGGYFLFQLPPYPWQKEETKPGCDHIAGEAATGIDKIGDRFRRQNGCAFDQSQVQPDPERRQGAGALHSVGNSAFTHHQARACEDTVAMRGLDGLIYGDVEAEIISRENNPLQDAIC